LPKVGDQRALFVQPNLAGKNDEQLAAWLVFGDDLVARLVVLHLGEGEDAQDFLVGQVPEQRHLLEHLDLAVQLLRTRIGGRGGVGVDAQDDGGDVVVPAARVGVVDQLARDGGDAFLGKLARDFLLVEVGVQTVGAEQKLVAGQDFQIDGVDLHRLVDAEGARDRVLVRGVGRLGQRLARDLAVADELVDERVIFGELHRLPAAHHVDAAVADMGDEAALADEQEGRNRGAHAALLGLFLAAFEDGKTRGLHRVFKYAQHVVRGHARVVTRVGVDDVAPTVHRAAEFIDRHL
jgi:hypothetical protein